jgi:SAM-dependent methyltransferase
VSTRWQRIARQQGGEDYAAAYADRFRVMATDGGDVHGEANFVTGVTAAPARVLDARCGTGRVAARLAQLGYDVVGCDVDPTHLVAGFGLDAAHLPDGCPPLALATFDAAMANVGMRACARWATWDRQPFQDDGYVVAVYEPDNLTASLAGSDDFRELRGS